MTFERIYPLDAAFDTLADAPPEIRENKRYRERGDFSIAGVVARLREDFGDHPLDIVVHSLANGPEVKKALIDTSRQDTLAPWASPPTAIVAFVRELGRADAARRLRSSRSPTWRANARFRGMAAGCRRPRRRSNRIPARWRSRPAAASACASTPFPPGRTPRAPRRPSASSRAMVHYSHDNSPLLRAISMRRTSATRRRSSAHRWPPAITGTHRLRRQRLSRHGDGGGPAVGGVAVLSAARSLPA